MPMPRLAAATLALTAVACATGAGARRLEREGNATLTGIIVPPPSEVRKESTSCSGVMVRAAHVSAPDTALGNLLVKPSRGRCLYVLSNLPSEAELQVSVRPSAAWRCEGGSPPRLRPAPHEVKLRDYETATRDFRVTCE